MYADKNLKPIPDTAPYVGEDGVKHPGSFPKSSIPGLHKVTLTDPPSGSNIVVTGFFINASYEQVWTSREKTEQELLDELHAARGVLAVQAQTKIEETDLVALRCVKAGVPFTEAWLNYVAALRAVVRGESETVPNPPMDESGNVIYPAGS